MESFMYYNPTKLFFGKGQLKVLPKEVAKYGKKVLVVYGGGSIKRNGIYEQVMEKLNEIDAEVFEFSGVESNPRVTTVRKGVEICKKEKIEFILAVGGGSVIDCTKAIAVGAKADADIWDIVTKKVRATDGVPYGVVVTIAGTGAEMSRGSVITKWETNEKFSWGSSFSHSKFSILDPTFTFSVPREQTVNGVVDTMSHVLEHYFHHTTNTPIQDQFCESILRTVKEAGTKLLDDLDNFEHRETVMFSSTLALNDSLNMGYSGDWGTHHIDHALSAVHDIPHGGGMAILFPHWMRYVLDDENAYRFKQLAVRVFDVESADKTDYEVATEGIKKLSELWRSWGAPTRLADYKINEDSIELVAEKTVQLHSEFGNFKKLTKEDAVAILKASL